MKYVFAFLMLFSSLSQAGNQLQIDPKLQALLNSLLDFDSIFTPPPEEQVKELMYEKIQKQLTAAVEENDIVGPIILAICADKKATRQGQQQFRIDTSHFLEVAEYEGKMSAVSNLISLGERVDKSITSPRTAQEVYVALANNFLYECVEDLDTDLKKSNVAVSSGALLHEVEFEIINRAKKIFMDWNFLMDGKVDENFHIKSAAQTELELRKIRDAILNQKNRNSTSGLRFQNAKDSRANSNRRGRGSI